MVLDWIELNGSHGVCVCVCSAVPAFSDDRDKAFSVSSAEWHHLSNHDAARQIHHKRQREALDRGLDVHKVETSLPTAKTCRVDRYCDYIREAVKHFGQLYVHYLPMRQVRWTTYQREQWALHTLCMRIKGDPLAKRSDIIAAFGAAGFPSAKKGSRPAPVKKFREHLKRYVTVVMVDEFRTSRMCSKLCALEGVLPSSAAPEADAGAAESGHDLVAEEEDEGGGEGGGVERERVKKEEEAIKKR